MNIEYSVGLREKAKEKLIEEFDKVCAVGYGKIEVHFNARTKRIDIVPSPHFGIGEPEQFALKVGSQEKP